MKLEKNDIILNGDYREYLKDLVYHLSTDGRKDLILKAQENPEEIRTSRIKAPSSRNPKKLIQVFEGYHLKDFVYSLLPTLDGTQKPSNEKNHVPRQKFLEKYKYPDSFLRDFPSTNGNIMAEETVESLFDNLAEYFQTSLFQLLLSFFQYCYNTHLPLRIFDSNRDKLGCAIKDMEQYKLIYPELEEEELESLRRLSEAKKRTKLHNDRLKYLVSQPIVEGLESVKKGEISLNPLNHKSIELIGRDEEIKQLDNFLEAPDAFKMMFMVAPSGAGKTRLITQWYSECKKLINWQSGFIDNDTGLNEWQRWQSEEIECDTLLVVDYIYRFTAIIRSITKKGALHGKAHLSKSVAFSNDTNRGKFPKLRLILLDHTFHDSREYSQFDANQKEATEPASWRGFRHEVLWLGRYDNERHELMMIKLIAQGAGWLSDDKIKNEAIVKNAYKTLCAMDNLGISQPNDVGLKFANQPLYGVLIGQALRLCSLKGSGQNQLNRWKRRDLIEFYFKEREYRLPWLTDELLGVWVGAAVSAAIICQGITFKNIINILNGAVYNDVKLSWVSKRRDSFLASCNHIVSSRDTDSLVRYQPDIIGETFFLIFFQYIQDEKDVCSSFFELINSQTENSNPATINDRVIEFITRLVRNLANDIIDSKMDSLWSTLIEFLNPKNFSNNDSMQLSCSIAILESLQEFKLRPEKEVSELESKAEILIDKVRFDLLERTFNQYSEIGSHASKDTIRIWWKSLSSIIIYFDWMIKSNKLNSSIEMKIHNVLNSYEAQCLRIYRTRFHLLSSIDSYHLLSWIVKKNGASNLNQVDKAGWTPLLEACYYGLPSTVELLLDANARNHISLSDGTTTLMIACRYNHRAIVDTLLEKTKVNVNESNLYSETPLTLACKYGHTAIVERLLKEESISVDKRTQYSLTALIESCRYNSFECAFLLLSAGADKNKAAGIGNITPLISASRYGSSECVELLIYAQANELATTQDSNMNALMYAAEYGHDQCLELLIKTNLEIDGRDSNGRTALFFSCREGNTLCTELLLKAGARKDKDRAFIEACKNGHAECALLLIESGVNKDLVATHGWTGLFWSCRYGDEYCTSILIHCKVNLNITDNYNQTALMHACYHGHTACTQLLLDNDAKKDFQDHENKTALIIASRKGHADCLYELLKAGANKDKTDIDGWTALMHACYLGHTQCVSHLVGFGANMDYFEMHKKRTALMISCIRGHIGCVKILLREGANRELFDYENNTAFTIALNRGYKDCADLLRGA